MISTVFRSVFVCLLVSVVLAFPGLLHADNKKTLYFYSPEVSTARNTVLKGTFDQYFESKGNLVFQPVMQQSIFEELLVSGQADALIMSSDHFFQLSNNISDLSSNYLPVLQGLRNGSDSYLKLLVSSSQELDFNHGQILASSSNEALTLDFLNSMFPEGAKPNLGALNILEVPKDIDALMAVGYGLADMALTTDDSLSTLSTLYKDQYEQLKIVGTSIPQKRMILILSRESIEDELLSGALVYTMPQSPIGRRAMKLIGLDSWRWLLDEKSSQGGKQ